MAPSLIVALLLSVAPEDLVLARTFTNELVSGDLDAAAARLGPEVAAIFEGPKRQYLWDNSGFLGRFERISGVRADGKFIITTCVYERGLVKVKITLDEQKKVTSYWVSSGTPNEDFDLAGREVGEALASHAWSKVVERFTPETAKALPAAELARAWARVTKDAGSFRRVAEVKNDRTAALITPVDVTFEFTKQKVVVRFSFDGALKIHGLVFNP